MMNLLDRVLDPYKYLSVPKRLITFFKRQCIRFTSDTPKVDFMIVGAQKAGTSGLFFTLAKHSKLVRPDFLKELHYFSNDTWYAKRQIKQYHSFFPLVKQQGIQFFEACPNYLYQPRAAERIYEYNPKLKIIIMLRNPTARTFAAWKMHHYKFSKGKNTLPLYDARSFEEAITGELEAVKKGVASHQDDHFGYIKRSLYVEQIRCYKKLFKEKQLLFIEQEELKKNPENTLREVLAFLGVSYEPLELRIFNVSKKEALDADMNTKLKEFFSSHNAELFKEIGKSYHW